MVIAVLYSAPIFNGDQTGRLAFRAMLEQRVGEGDGNGETSMLDGGSTCGHVTWLWPRPRKVLTDSNRRHIGETSASTMDSGGSEECNACGVVMMNECGTMATVRRVIGVCCQSCEMDE